MAVRSWVLAGGLTALTLAGCGQAHEYSDSSADVAMEMVVPGVSGAGATADAAATDAAPGAAARAPAVRAPQIAYTYDYTLTTRPGAALALMQRHEAACVKAGPAVCRVVDSVSRRRGRDDVSASLTLRAQPGWLTPFRGGLQAQAEAAGGKVITASASSEDLSREIVDTEARVRAMTTLRDRLQQLLATRSAPLDQLLQTERELARVQGDLDSTQSMLNEMRGRVATSMLTVNYEPVSQIAPDSAFRPVKAALDNALSVMMTVLGGMILILAAAIPLAVVIVPVGWLVRRLWKRRRERRAAKDSTPAS